MFYKLDWRMNHWHRFLAQIRQNEKKIDGQNHWLQNGSSQMQHSNKGFDTPDQFLKPPYH